MTFATSSCTLLQSKNEDDCNNNSSEENENETNPKTDKSKALSINDRINVFLDTPFFDPDEIIEVEGYNEDKNQKKANNPILLWFAQLVKNDYQTAETFYAAGFISVLVIFTQELLRMVRYGDAYIPFTKIRNGSLF